MNAVAGRPRTGYKFMLIVKEGPDKGVSYQLLPPRVTIGRGDENDVVLSDPRVSRQAAIIEFAHDKISLTNISSRQPILVNRKPISETSLSDGEEIRVGDSILVFNVEAMDLAVAAAASMQASAPMSLRDSEAPHSFMPPPQTPPPRSRSSSRAPQDNGKRNFYIMVGLGLLLLVWLLNSDPKQRAKEPTLKTIEEIQKENEESEKRNEELVKRRTFKNDEEKTRFEEANRHYLEGFRDYQKGQWSRALRSFETARAIDPSHELSKRYFKLAEKQRDEMVAELTLEGRRYREKQMYSRCSAAFEKVLDVITNRDDLKYKQAATMKRECDLMKEDRFH
jgi:pSer/pThr/pTyr-binding forkhead associated (FHA) protein